MIFHSIIPYDVVFQDQNSEMGNFTSRIINYSGCQVEVTMTNSSMPQIMRIHSTSPKDYLNPKLQPGMVVDHIR